MSVKYLERKPDLDKNTVVIKKMISKDIKKRTQEYILREMIEEGINSATESLINHMPTIMQKYKETVLQNMDQVLNAGKRSIISSETEFCEECYEKVEALEKRYNQLNDENQKLVKEKEEISMITKRGVIPYVVFLLVSSGILFSATTLHIAWRMTGTKIVEPVTSFMVSLMALGWTATAFVGVIQKRKENF